MKANKQSEKAVDFMRSILDKNKYIEHNCKGIIVFVLKGSQCPNCKMIIEEEEKK